SPNSIRVTTPLGFLMLASLPTKLGRSSALIGSDLVSGCVNALASANTPPMARIARTGTRAMLIGPRGGPAGASSTFSVSTMYVTSVTVIIAAEARHHLHVA